MLLGCRKRKRKGTLIIQVKDIELIVYDFDGVMTDNRAIVLQDGTEAVFVNRSDGLGVEQIRSFGIAQLIVSSEANPVVKARAEKLGLEVIASCKNKKDILKNYCNQKNYDLKKVIFVGNDFNDLEAMKIVGFPVAPADAYPEIIKTARLVTKASGGQGVVRELSGILVTGDNHG
ncbi:MAG: HAD hydrolase family protein [Planctomycetes bacterium]|nr:HAD hydrolase family protein [Planctomycetota bacterium]